MDQQDEVVSKIPLIGKRHSQFLLQILYYVIIFAIEGSLGVAISSMTDKETGVIPVHYNDRRDEMEFLMEILRIYFIGFVLTCLSSGWICKRFGFKWPMVAAMLIISLFTISLPFITNCFGVRGLIACRLIQGICAGFGFAMPSEFVSKWIPFPERIVLGAAIYASPRLGLGANVLLARFLCEKFGWEILFIQYGFLAMAWAVLMVVFGAESPEELKNHMSATEMNYITENRGSIKPNSLTMQMIPWRQMCTSPAVWAIIIAQIGASWLMCVQAMQLSIFFRIDFGVHFEIFNSMMLIALTASFFMNVIAQFFTNKGKITVEQSRKILNTIGTLVPAAILILLIFLTGDSIEGYIIFFLILFSSYGTISGSRLNINDISPNFAPIIYCTTEWTGQVFNVIIILSLQDKHFNNWSVLFGLTAALLFVTNYIFLRFGSGEEEEWDSYENVLDAESDLSKSSNYVSCEESKYLLFVRKQ